MKVVYLFKENENFRVPFFGSDLNLFVFLKEQGGKWNKDRNEFVFQKSTSIFGLSRLFPNVPFVQVDESSAFPFRVSGFFRQEPEKAVDKIELKEDYHELPPPRPEEKFNIHFEDKLQTELRARKYSRRTINSYVYFNRLLCRNLQKSPAEIQGEDVKFFLANMERDKNYSSSSINLAISAIKFFYKNVLLKDIVKEKTRPRHDKQLPMVLDKGEIDKILSKELNAKHRLLLMLVYSSGLRVSEVVNLKREHIDLERMLIHIRLGKGRKDRFTILSTRVAGFMEKYYELCDIKTWLFPGQQPGRHLSIRSAQHIFDKAIKRAEINKNISIHSLRHTFATHLLESGTDIRYIQELLGHSNVRTTERYTHVARRNVLKIQSPLDSM